MLFFYSKRLFIFAKIIINVKSTLHISESVKGNQKSFTPFSIFNYPFLPTPPYYLIIRQLRIFAVFQRRPIQTSLCCYVTNLRNYYQTKTH
jgi:hypothetical protein